MKSDNGPIIDMTPEGGFAGSSTFKPGRHPPANGLSLGMIAARIAAFGVVDGFAVLVFWLAIFTLPLIFLGGLVLYGVYRYQMMRFRRGRSSNNGFDRRNPFIVIRR